MHLPQFLYTISYKEHFGLKIEIVSFSNPIKLTWTNAPIMYMHNIAWSKQGVRIAKLACANNMKVNSSHSEAMFNLNTSVDEPFWGWNHQHKICFDKLFLWNKLSMKRVLEKYPGLIDKLEVSGSIGHERYKYVIMDRLAVSLKKGLRWRESCQVIACGVYESWKNL